MNTDSVALSIILGVVLCLTVVILPQRMYSLKVQLNEQKQALIELKQVSEDHFTFHAQQLAVLLKILTELQALPIKPTHHLEKVEKDYK